MNDQSRIFYFWFGCIPMRVLIGFVASYISLQKNKMLSFILGIYTSTTSFTFTVNALRVLTKEKIKGGLGGSIWWNKARVSHIVIWSSCAILSFMNVEWSGVLLLIDACLGILYGILHYKYHIIL